ncbi:putative LRR receptor-like serine/threonine-protein kinase [Dichanthelium oligosanthes]|uniref:Receptor kinase-like protein Xa21 n=1 Tax=Dichanthelium oligosanthes TaxID=888268 RepID=A0A1E5V319_9POAL|nr:putative LRR receptor-like serine/threonine-protein kinase [Dichanthelium oligosanthes]
MVSAYTGNTGSPVLVAVLLACLSCFISTASSTPTAPLQNASNADLQALLCLKLHLSNTTGAMASWKNDSVQYCSWPGVTCAKRHASRVVSLALDSANLHGQIPPCIGNLTFLRSIHLPNNQLNGHIPPELARLNHITYLNLSSNSLTGMIPNTLSSCSSLQIIDLSNNFLESEIPASLRKCLKLQEIYLFSNKLYGSIPDSLGTLSYLSVLFLANNNLTGNIPSTLGSNSFLYAVVLTNNTLTGGIPPLLANSSSLGWLDLTNNHLSGEIPSALFNSSSIAILALGVNNFVGSIPPLVRSPLNILILSKNNLSGSIPSSLGNISSLTWLSLSQNNFQGAIPSSLSLIPNLEQLSLTFNNLSGTVPASLYNITTLKYLAIGTNSLSGQIPYDIGHTLPNIETLILQGNNFKGQIPSSLADATNIQVLNLRDNLLHGVVPSFGNLSSLIELNLGMNQLEAGDWSFLSSLTNCSQLVQLCLDRNILKGMLPNSFGDLPMSLQVLLLTANEISGTIPQEIEHLKNLTLLYMEHNLLAGNLPDSIGNLPNLFVLRLSHNRLSGEIPSSIGYLSQLSELHLEENNFSGSIPRALGYCKSLETLNLSRNSFSGSIPKELFTLSTLSEGLDLSYNELFGEIPLEIGGLINLGLLNISNNRLSGEIPSTLGDCMHLESLHMEGNLLHGTIPESFINLRGVTEMDLSRNNLSGELPEFFESFSSMKLLNLSFNNLEGPVPSGGIFQNTGEVFIQGNKLLCASIPLLQLPLCSSQASKKSRASDILKIVGFTALSLVVLSCFAVTLLKKRKQVKQASHPSCMKLRKFSYADLVKATNGFSLANLIGSGKSGSVYKGRFELEEHTVAIKVFKLDTVGAPKTFLAECEALKNTRHRNLLKVITACSTFDPSGHEFKALILEYMPNGNLESWLYPKVNMYGLKRPLNLGSRITIAMDVASALDYLHNHSVPPLVHCDLKPSNILLDDVMGARLADFGLAKFLQSFSDSCHHSSTSLLGPRGSIGYIAPEYGFGRKLSTEGDVYSYGIIILEILTGKRPTDEMFTNGLNLHEYVEKAFPQKIAEVLDPCIFPSSEDGDVDNNLDQGNNATAGMESCIMHLVKLGLSCSMETPKDRPTMQDVYAEIITIKKAFAALHG